MDAKAPYGAAETPCHFGTAIHAGQKENQTQEDDQAGLPGGRFSTRNHQCLDSEVETRGTGGAQMVTI